MSEYVRSFVVQMPSDGPQKPSLATRLAELRSRDPRRYTLLQQHCEDLRYVLEQSNRNYASAQQLHALWDDPPFQSQILGQLLSTVALFGVLRVHARRSTRNRYDLTAYDRAQMRHLADALAVDSGSTDSQTTREQ